MRLSQFILLRQARILDEWDAFASGLSALTSRMDRTAIRDHAAEILAAIAKDLTEAQTAEQQTEKSKGHAPYDQRAPATAAQTHALLRARSGFDINQMAAEYRALRASVLRLWAEEFKSETTALEDTIRFNEAVDQSLVESIAYFTTEVDRSRNLLLGMLGHDMRTPLNVVVLTAQWLKKLNAGDVVSTAAGRLISSGAQIRALLDDLVDFNRTNLGVGIRIRRIPADLEGVIFSQVQLLRAENPDRLIDFESCGNTLGQWDTDRVRQAVGNLITNALKYGDASRPVKVLLVGHSTLVEFSVINEGEAIPADQLETLFEPLKKGLRAATVDEGHDSLGLGLYITQEIARAHGGKVDVSSDGKQTVFRVELPREVQQLEPDG